MSVFMGVSAIQISKFDSNISLYCQRAIIKDAKWNAIYYLVFRMKPMPPPEWEGEELDFRRQEVREVSRGGAGVGVGGGER